MCIAEPPSPLSHFYLCKKKLVNPSQYLYGKNGIEKVVVTRLARFCLIHCVVTTKAGLSHIYPI